MPSVSQVQRWLPRWLVLLLLAALVGCQKRWQHGETVVYHGDPLVIGLLVFGGVAMLLIGGLKLLIDWRDHQTYKPLIGGVCLLLLGYSTWADRIVITPESFREVDVRVGMREVVEIPFAKIRAIRYHEQQRRDWKRSFTTYELDCQLVTGEMRIVSLQNREAAQEVLARAAAHSIAITGLDVLADSR